jgi:hypothetical protein
MNKPVIENLNLPLIRYLSLSDRAAGYDMEAIRASFRQQFGHNEGIEAVFKEVLSLTPQQAFDKLVLAEPTSDYEALFQRTLIEGTDFNPGHLAVN